MQNKNKLNPSDATQHAIDYWQILKNRWGIILLTFVLVVLTAGVITYVMPKKYEAKTIVKINPLGTKSQVMEGAQSSQMTRQFFGTQFKIIESEENLKRAAMMFQLSEKLGVSEFEALSLLKEAVETSQERGTDLIEISLRMRKEHREYVKDLTKFVALAYSEMRIAKEDKTREQARAELEKQIQRLEDVVVDYRNRLLQFSAETGIIYFDQNNAGGTTDTVRRGVMLNEQLYDEAIKLRDELELQVKNLVSLTDDALISHVAGLNRPESAIVTQTFEQFLETKRERSGKIAEGLGANHPQVRLLDARISDLQADLDDKVVRVRELLKVQLAESQAKVVRLKTSSQAKEGDARESAADYTLFNTYKQEYESALKNLERARTNDLIEGAQENMSLDPIEFWAFPKEPEVKDYVSPNLILNMSLGCFAGLIFGVGIAFSLELMDTSVKTMDDVERYLQVPVLAVVPRDVGLLHKQKTASPDAEAYRILRTNIEFNRTSPDQNAITVVSGGAGEGKSTTLVNLAYICAQGGYSTLMIDADLRRPRVHTLFDVGNSVGLTNYLTTDLELEDVVLKTPVENLFLMPSGILPTDAAGILNSRRMTELMREVKERFDLVLVDSPPILGVSDASVISSEVDLTMIVVQHKKLPRNMLIRVKQAVENVGGTVLGVVLNNVDLRSDSQYQYYTSYYTYYSPQKESAKSNGKLGKADSGDLY